MKATIQQEKNRGLSISQISKTMLVDLVSLKTHEDVDQEYLKELQAEIISDGVLKFAIAVDIATKIILDGNHRFNALWDLGAKRIPVTLVNYGSVHISVEGWRNGSKVTKEIVVAAGLSGNKLSPKTSKHMVNINGERRHISAIERNVNYPLKDLF